jgi:hypothetical protein
LSAVLPTEAGKSTASSTPSFATAGVAVLRRELPEWLGRSRTHSVPNLTGQLQARMKASPKLTGDLA